MDDSESWNTHEFQEYRVHHEFELQTISDVRGDSGNMRPITITTAAGDRAALAWDFFDLLQTKNILNTFVGTVGADRVLS